jgi:hypothetical protein
MELTIHNQVEALPKKETATDKRAATGSADGSSALASKSVNAKGPVFILAVPRSFSSVACAMLGQHPQMYGLPELHLFRYETVAERALACARAPKAMGHGLLRAIAQLYFGGQNDSAIELAEGWLRRRTHFTTGYLFEKIAARIAPAIPVEKSPSMVYSVDAMDRAHTMFPDATFIHLTRHPRGQGESILKFIDERKRYGPIPRSHWLVHLARFPNLSRSNFRQAELSPEPDPQKGWYVLNHNICKFLESVPENRKLRIRGEDLLTKPDEILRFIAGSLGLRADDVAIEDMKHPERSPYACFGPARARYGSDALFLSNPALRPQQVQPQSLAGPLSWRHDNAGFLPRVKELAIMIGYE